MTDLHGWVTQQVDRVEALAKAATPGPWEGVVDHHQRGEVNASVWSDKLGYYITEQISSGERQEADARHIGEHNPAAVLRRCVADRKILGDHTTFGDGSVHCIGCGVDYESGPLVENVNDCPTLLALAEGYGLTPETLAGLDRPQPPALKPRGPTPDTRHVPPALRGPNWRDQP